MNIKTQNWLIPDWPAPDTVQAVTTTRLGGVSVGEFASMNLALHVGDEPDHVLANRRQLLQTLALPSEPMWLNQVHGTGVVDAGHVLSTAAVEGDGSFTTLPDKVCVVMTADCLPVLLCNEAGDRVAALHAGWRGLAAGILETGVAALHCPPQQILAWLGPAIGPQSFEVGAEVRQAFISQHPAAAQGFVSAGDGKFLADLYYLARLRLQSAGVRHIYGGGWCTYTDSERFYSYRRDGKTGRMASLIWLAQGQ